MGSIRMIAVSAVLTAGLFSAGAATAQDRDVQIVRGGQTAGIIESREANVRVFRGSPATTTAPAERAMAEASAANGIVTAGSRVWFVDHAAGTLRTCRLAATTQVGEHRIDCHSRALPR